MSESKKTEIEKINGEEVVIRITDFVNLTTDDIYKSIFDLSLPTEDRIELVKIYNEKIPAEIGNVINRLNSMYVFSFSKVIERFLIDIIHQIDIDTYLKFESAKVLTYHSKKGYETLDWLCSLSNKDIATLFKVDCICYLVKDPDYIQNAYTYLLNIVSDYNLECLYRYKIILSLERIIKDEDIKKDFIKKLCIHFLRDENNLITGRILASQNLLRNYLSKKDDQREYMSEAKEKNDQDLREYIQDILLDFGGDLNLNENVRADAIDVLLQYGDDESRKIATRMIVALGTREGKARTIFDNSQNVHHRSIEESANGILEYLNTIQTKNKDKIEINFDDVRDDILKMIEGKDRDLVNKIEMSLTRIFLDRAVYSQFNMTLMNILIKMWAYIDNHEYREAMRERLIEELAEASEVCSTGYAFRIINVLSGFGEMSITISFEDQVIANLEGRLNAKIRELEDVDFASDVMAEMIIDPSNCEARGNFLKFFRSVISNIRQDMYLEFKDYMTDTDYDMYFRKALIHYEGYN